MSTGKKLFVLDTNVLIDDPKCLDHLPGDKFIPYTVLRELKGLTDAEGGKGYGAREALRNIDALMRRVEPSSTGNGVPIVPTGVDTVSSQEPCGMLYFGNVKPSKNKNPDLRIVDEIWRLAEESWVRERYLGGVVLVTNDLTFRLDAQKDFGLEVQPYDLSMIPRVGHTYSGYTTLDEEFWKDHTFNEVQKSSRILVRIRGPLVNGWHPGLCVSSDERSFSARVLEISRKGALLIPHVDYQVVSLWGTNALNREQSFALNALLDPDVDLVTLEGVAGTGKTLIALLAGMYATHESNRYDGIVVTRATVPLGEEIGFTPGDEVEKMAPWMHCVMDNRAVIDRRREQTTSSGKHVWRTDGIEIRSINFMRGRSFQKRFFIIEEAQNLRMKVLKALVSRAGHGTKVVCVGNLDQIDPPGMHPATSGFTTLVEHSKSWSYAAHFTLKGAVRSRLAEWANTLPS